MNILYSIIADFQIGNPGLNDLRCVEVLSMHGYPLQAACVAASLFETAYALAFIGSDESLAEEWANHSDPTKPFRRARDLVRGGLQRLRVPDISAQLRVEYRVYSQLCMAKHTNPILQMEYGVALGGSAIEFSNGPETSDQAIRALWFVLEHSGALVGVIAAGIFIGEHVPETKGPLLAKELHRVGQLRKRLEAKAKSRWGTEDPFPGRW